VIPAIVRRRCMPFPALSARRPEDVFACFAREPGAVLLLSGGPFDAEYSYLCLDPAAFLVYRDGACLLQAGKKRFPTEEPLRFMDAFCALNRAYACGGAFRGGMAGYLSYEFRTAIENVPAANPGSEGLPGAFFVFPRTILVYEHATGSWELVSLAYACGEAVLPGGRTPDDILAALADPPPVSFPRVEAERLSSDVTRAEHIRAVEKTRGYIARGDIYQANIARRFSVPLSGDPYPLLVEIYRANPAPFFAYVNAGDHMVLSSSPELLVRLRGDEVESKPIKGTAPRMADPAADAASRLGLEESTKDAAELAMIVDLVRNDLGRVCRAGTVEVCNHREIRAYTNVYHTLSTVRGVRAPRAGPGRILHALFPGGSVTGCPKIRAMEIIDEIERSARNVYTGSIGYVAADGDMVFNIAIRTALVRNGVLHFFAGGGIVYDSDPEKEFDETTDKAATWLETFVRRSSPRRKKERA